MIGCFLLAPSSWAAGQCPKFYFIYWLVIGMSEDRRSLWLPTPKPPRMELGAYSKSLFSAKTIWSPRGETQGLYIWFLCILKPWVVFPRQYYFDSLFLDTPWQSTHFSSIPQPSTGDQHQASGCIHRHSLQCRYRNDKPGHGGVWFLDSVDTVSKNVTNYSNFDYSHALLIRKIQGLLFVHQWRLSFILSITTCYQTDQSPVMTC